MLTFHPLSLADKPWIDQIVFSQNSRSADFCFGSMYLWDQRYCQQVTQSGSRLVVLSNGHGAPIFPYPIGTGPLVPVIEEMRNYAAAHNFPFVLRGVEEEGSAALRQCFPGHFDFSEDREYADYIYAAEKLAALSGKKLHAKKNYVNRFTSDHNWAFCQMEKIHFPRCLALLEDWDRAEGSEAETVVGEHAAILRAFEHFDALELVGGVLFADGILAAFTIAERISADTVDVHFEKAYGNMPGAYAVINREFAALVRSRWPEVQYLNREDDMGLDNLRQAKLSYHPEFLLKKYTARWRD